MYNKYGVEQASQNITVTVLEKPDIRCSRRNDSPATHVQPGQSVRLDPCPGGFTGAFEDSDYMFTWSGVATLPYIGDRERLAALDATDRQTAVFTAPTASPYSQLMYYTLQGGGIGREYGSLLCNAYRNVDYFPEQASIKRYLFEIFVRCERGRGRFSSGLHGLRRVEPGSPYTWSWSPVGNLTGRDTGTPIFDVPANVNGDTTYTYTVSVSAQDHLFGSGNR